MRKNAVVFVLFFVIQAAIVFSIENPDFEQLAKVSLREAQSNKEAASSNSAAQSKIDEFPPLTGKLSVGEIAFGFRKNNVTIPLLNRMKLESVSFQTYAAKDFFILVFRGLSDSASILLSLRDYKLISDDGLISCCKGFKPLFTDAAINSASSFNINDSIGFRYGGDGKHELFFCLLFVVDKQAKNMRLLYKDHTSKIIQELDANAIKRDSLYYKDESADFALTSLTEMSLYDKESFSLYGAYPVQAQPVASGFLGSKEVEINDITRYTEDLVIATVTLKDNSCASDDSLVLDNTFRAAIQTDDNIWIDSKGVILEFSAGEFGPEKSYKLCNYTEESSNLKFINSHLVLTKGTKINIPFFPEYINCHINKLGSNSFRTVIPLIFQITEDKKIAAFQFANFPEIQLPGFDLLSKISKNYAPSRYKNSLTVINETGEVAFVKIVNIKTASAEELGIIENGARRTFFLQNGVYKELVRLGCTPPYKEFKGKENMDLTALGLKYIEATLTLQPIVNGNHQTDGCAPGEFDEIKKRAQ